MHNVKKSFKRLLAVSLCASCVLSNGMLSLAEGAEDKAVNLALGCQATANAQYNQNGNDMSASKAVDAFLTDYMGGKAGIAFFLVSSK